MGELHCWHDKGADAELGSDEWVEAMAEPGTCMLLDGHDGPHVYTPDDQISVTFADRDDMPNLSTDLHYLIHDCAFVVRISPGTEDHGPALVSVNYGIQGEHEFLASGTIAEAVAIVANHFRALFAADEDIIVECPQCGAGQVDMDGFGVIYCEACGYCKHVSCDVIDGETICGICGMAVTA